MTSLRLRMLEDMQIRNLAVNTQESYVQQVSLFARYFNQSPEQLGPEEIRTYQVYLTKEKKVATGSILIAISALRFLYKVTLKKHWPFADIIPAHAPGRDFQSSDCGYRRRAGQVQLAGLPRQQSAENYASLGRGVHPAIPAPRSAQWIPPHTLLRVPGQSIPQREVTALPPTPGHASNQPKLFPTPAMPGLSGSIREAHRSLSAGMPGLSPWPDDHGQVTGQGSSSPDRPRYLMIDPPDCKSPPPLNSKLLSRRSGVVLRAFRPPCDQPNTSIMPHSCSPKPMNSVHRYVPIHYRRFVLPTRNFPSPYKTHSARIPACGSAQ